MKRLSVLVAILTVLACATDGMAYGIFYVADCDDPGPPDAQEFTFHDSSYCRPWTEFLSPEDPEAKDYLYWEPTTIYYHYGVGTTDIFGDYEFWGDAPEDGAEGAIDEWDDIDGEIQFTHTSSGDSENSPSDGIMTIFFSKAFDDF